MIIWYRSHLLREPGFTPLKRDGKNGEDHTTRGRGPILEPSDQIIDIPKSRGNIEKKVGNLVLMPGNCHRPWVKSHGSVKKSPLWAVAVFTVFFSWGEVVFSSQDLLRLHVSKLHQNYCLVSSADVITISSAKIHFQAATLIFANTSIIPGRTSSGSMVRSDVLEAFVRSKPGVDGNWSLSGKGLKVWCQPWWIKHEPWEKNKKTGSLTFQMNPGGV